MKPSLSAAGVILALTTSPAGAQITLPEAASQTASVEELRDRVSLPVGVMTLDGAGTRRLEGRVLRQAFVMEARDRITPLALLEGAVDPLRRGDWELVFDCVDSGCGGAVARFALPLLPAPDMRLDTADMALATFRQGEAGGGREGGDARWVTVIVSRVLGELYVQITRLGPAAGDEAVETIALDTASDTASTGQDADAPAAPVVEAPDQQPRRAAEADDLAGLDPSDARALHARLVARGHVPLLGIEFETGGARIADGESAVIAAVVAMLRRHADLRVAVVGHTDYSGDTEINMALADRRASAVAEALFAAGVARNRLVTHSAGPFAPLTTNATAEGRALNRRVELVLIP
ncbi:MAG: OmpA family protein [Pseudomonadota bacterium]